MKPGSLFNTVTAAKAFYRKRWDCYQVYEKEIGRTVPAETLQGTVFVLFTIDSLSRAITNQVHVIIKD